MVRHSGALSALFFAVVIGGLALPASAETIRGTATVTATDDSDITVYTQLRYATLIVLPPGTEIVEGYTGDKAFWQIKREGNFVSVKPSRAGAKTNLQLLTRDGHVYSFLLTEVGKSGEQPDLKVFVNRKVEAVPAPVAVPAACDTTKLQQTQQLLETAHVAFQQTVNELQQARSDAAGKVDPSAFLSGLKSDYKLGRHAGEPPFSVTGIYHDDHHTYIRTAAREAPAIIELKDKKSNLISYSFANGVYRVDKVLDRGALRIGKKQVKFERKGN
jgi:type IV secretory pathway VirB9-like protein